MAMKTFTAAQWCLIDLASQFGYDKKPFEYRLQWGRERLKEIKETPNFELTPMAKFAREADEPEAFALRLLTIVDILEGRENGHLLGLDASSSGPQLLSVLCRCVRGMKNTGVLTEDVPDLYSLIRDIMKKWLPNVTREQIKEALIPWIYGSTSSALKVFQDYDLAAKFEAACQEAIPFAAYVRQVMIQGWDKTALNYKWELPDGHTSFVAVTQTMSYDSCRYQGKKYSYLRKENMTKDFGMSLPANITHSFDAYIVRELTARCYYNEKLFNAALKEINAVLDGTRNYAAINAKPNKEMMRLTALANKFKMVSVEIIESFKGCHTFAGVDTWILEALKLIIEKCLKHPPFPVRTIHDEFQALPNNINQMKQTYNDLLVEGYAGDWLVEVIKDVCNVELPANGRGQYNSDVLELIRNNTYAIN